MTKAKLVGRMILIALGAVVVWLSARGLMDIPVYRQALGSAVYLEEPAVLPENEGKMVIIHGKPEMTAPAYDDELGITLNSIKAYRYDEEYTKTIRKQNSDTYNWLSRGQKSIAGEAALGEFVLDEKMLIGFPADSDYENFDFAEISAAGYSIGRGLTDEGAMTDRWYVIVGGPEGEAYYYAPFENSREADVPRLTRELNQSIAEERDGTRAYAYKVFSGVVSEEMTVAGVQRGNLLEPHEKLGAVVNNGVLSQEELVKTRSASLAGGSIAFMALGLLLVVLGLRRGRKKAKK